MHAVSLQDLGSSGGGALSANKHNDQHVLLYKSYGGDAHRLEQRSNIRSGAAPSARSAMMLVGAEGAVAANV